MNRELDVQSILFAQDTISGRFRQGGDIEDETRRLLQLPFEERMRQVREVYPTIRVVELDGRYITLDHRRLHIFKALFTPGTEIPVTVVSDDASAKELKRKLGSRESTTTVMVRGRQKPDKVPNPELLTHEVSQISIRREKLDSHFL